MISVLYTPGKGESLYFKLLNAGQAAANILIDCINCIVKPFDYASIADK